MFTGELCSPSCTEYNLWPLGCSACRHGGRIHPHRCQRVGFHALYFFLSLKHRNGEQEGLCVPGSACPAWVRAKDPGLNAQHRMRECVCVCVILGVVVSTYNPCTLKASTQEDWEPKGERKPKVNKSGSAVLKHLSPQAWGEGGGREGRFSLRRVLSFPSPSRPLCALKNFLSCLHTFNLRRT